MNYTYTTFTIIWHYSSLVSQTEPIQIWSPKELSKAYEYLGINKKIGMTGRPKRPFGVLSTSKVIYDNLYTVIIACLYIYIIRHEVSFNMNFYKWSLGHVIKQAFGKLYNISRTSHESLYPFDKEISFYHMSFQPVFVWGNI